ncbi:neuropeptide SIFamide [Phlebotomus argentipes]|uniref:neuropeptide SIFamide n=1 Tax=Phlebotomus argentipes TaxID=94469 RepID=UPI002892A589|nr:neuropeptide SIFamide [Phlebotomus argentipes]
MSLRLLTLLVIICVFCIAMHSAEGTYRKPPFNGSIFGKRNSIGDYDSGGKALSAMCEIALEACGAWFPQDKK